ncbi:MAG TPA: ATP synthase F0 subunit C [bacterium]|jgi:F-type H+-transporting ATPase subunit c|nr:ATP synthase F0 subunit C [Dictyoglomota bacterium]HHV80435.1 ATP synthase F0 subunit C [bacterium]HOK29350.1 ATP synthase F0 subunit C [bacterium]HOL54703.1 ATP synthase F0 subunit C [bacterium]HPO81756.1 ATP synthase F0 subunit C [bacterium]
MLTGKALVIIASIISAGFGMGIAVLGGALGEGNAVSKAMESLGRQPEAQSSIMTILLLGLAFIESLVIFMLVVALVLLFVNPFVGMVQ